MTDGLAALVAESASHVEIADVAFAQELDGTLLVGKATTLHATLHNAVVFCGGGDHALAFERVIADGLLHVHVLAGLAGPNRCERVPVIRRADDYRVDGLVVVQLVQVLIGTRLGVAGSVVAMDGPSVWPVSISQTAARFRSWRRMKSPRWLLPRLPTPTMPRFTLSLADQERETAPAAMAAALRNSRRFIKTLRFF